MPLTEQQMNQLAKLNKQRERLQRLLEEDAEGWFERWSRNHSDGSGSYRTFRSVELTPNGFLVEFYDSPSGSVPPTNTVRFTLADRCDLSHEEERSQRQAAR